LNVQVKLYGLLRRYHPGPNPGAPLDIELPEGASVADAATTLNLPENWLHAAALNGVACEFDAPLREGDRVSLFPPAAGGSTRM
jgi:sulfur carrier protein ThiS